MTEVRDTVLAMLPSLLRIFTGGDKILEFVPKTAEDVEVAEQMTDFINYIFMQENPGFRILHDAMKDALILKEGVLTWYKQDKETVEEYSYSGLSQEEAALIAQDPQVTVLELQEEQIYTAQTNVVTMSPDMNMTPRVFSMRVKRVIREPRYIVECIPVEQFIIDNQATSIDDALVAGRRKLATVSELVAMGYDKDIVEKAGIVARLFNAIRVATYKLPGSLAVASLITCAIFSTATGIVGAVVTLMGLLAWPAMVNNGYNKQFASGVVTAGGCLGILIPPSIMFIVYAVVAALSPLRLFAAAMLPGLMLAGLYIIYVIVAASLNPKLAPKPKLSEIPPRAKIYKDLVVSFLPLFLIIVLVLGSILGGLATASEAAAVGAVGALGLELFYNLASILYYQSDRKQV